MMGHDAHGMVELEAVDTLRVGQGVEPALLDERVPRREERLAEGGRRVTAVVAPRTTMRWFVTFSALTTDRAKTLPT
jgi:hypothetical protein